MTAGPAVRAESSGFGLSAFACLVPQRRTLAAEALESRSSGTHRLIRSERCWSATTCKPSVREGGYGAASKSVGLLTALPRIG